MSCPAPGYRVLLLYAHGGPEWYDGSTYIHQGEFYPALAKNFFSARTYKRRCDAVRAAKSVIEKCAIDDYEIVEVSRA
ncbi:MAG: hypothetical protein HFJ72_08480 [Adlercreutzia sp.]|nr:hypothetical protein [Adlercreutzia sp.]